jgi:acetyltransferase-like isoleucine patch superfamily enzyme
MTDRFTEWELPAMEHNKLTKWNWMVSRPENLILGKNVDIGAFTYIAAHHGVIIETNVQIGSHCAIYSLNTEDDTKGLVTIKQGACVGSHVVIFPGVTIGMDAKVGAHSLVKRDIPDGELWWGIPCKFVKKIEKQSS